MESLNIPVTPPAADPSTVPDNVVDDGKGGVMVDPSKPASTEKPAADPNRPAWLPEKYKTPEDLVKAHNALTAKMSKEGAPKPSEQKPADAAAKAGLNLSELEAEYAKDGKLSEDSLAKLKATGLNESDINTYVEGRKAQAAMLQSELASAVGGDDAMKAALEWGAANLSPGEIAAYNAALDSGNVESAKLAVLGLASKFSAAEGTEPNLISGGNGGSGTGPAYESWEQVREAMADPKYKRDPAFRAKVEKQLARSNLG